MQNLLRQGGMQPPKLIYTYKFRLRGPEIKQFFAQQMQNFHRQVGVQTPKVIYRPTISCLNLD